MKSATMLPAALPFIALMAIALSLELAAAWLAYHTLGEILSSLLFMSVALNLIPIVFYILRKRSVARVVTLALFLAIVPYQAVLGYRMVSLQQEASSVVAYVYETRLNTGEFPADLSGYTWGSKGLQPYFQEYHKTAESGGFSLFWYVGTPNTSHFYSPLLGWGYYPD